MPYDNSPQANLPRFNVPSYVTQDEFDNAISNLQSQINSGDQEGENFRIESSVFSFKNTTTGLFNRVDSEGNNDTVHLEVSDGVA